MNNVLPITLALWKVVGPTDTPKSSIHEALRQYDHEDIDEVLRLLCASKSIVEVSPSVYQRWHGTAAQELLATRRRLGLL
jgi:hypothetical protein